MVLCDVGEKWEIFSNKEQENCLVCSNRLNKLSGGQTKLACWSVALLRALVRGTLSCCLCNFLLSLVPQ